MGKRIFDKKILVISSKNYHDGRHLDREASLPNIDEEVSLYKYH
jgi:hypothetical protein